MSVYVPSWSLNEEVVGFVRENEEGRHYLDEDIKMDENEEPIIPEGTVWVLFADRNGLCHFVPLEQGEQHEELLA